MLQIDIQLMVPFIKKTAMQVGTALCVLAALLIGFIIAKSIEKTIIFVLDLLNADKLLKAVKFTALMEKGEVKKRPSEIVGAFVYWVVIYFLIVSLLFISGFQVEASLDKIFSSLSVILLAAVVLSLGSFFGILFGSLVFIITVNLGVPGAKTISKITQYSTVVVAFLLALEQLGIGSALLVPSIGVIIGAVGLAVAIAFGLGCKDIMADFVSNLIKGR